MKKYNNSEPDTSNKAQFRTHIPEPRWQQIVSLLIVALVVVFFWFFVIHK